MTSGDPPSSRSYLAQDPSLVTARGKLRDGIGSLRNLDQLLKSLRVGPKALQGVIPDIRGACAECGKAAEQLLGTVAQAPALRDAAEQLKGYWAPRLASLEGALDRAARQSLNAKHRLELEIIVQEASMELERGLELLDLLEEVVWAPAFPLEMAELVRETLGEPASEGETLAVSVSGFETSLEVRVQPRVIVSLLRLGANWVVRGGAPSAHIRLHHASDGPVIRFEPGSPTNTRHASVRRRQLPDLALACAQAAAHHIRCHLQSEGECLVLRGLVPATS